MDKFAFLLHPLGMQDVYNFAPESMHRNSELVKAIMKKWMPPFPVKRFRITSLTGREIEGVVISVPLLPEQFFDSDQRQCLEKILAAGRMAEEMDAKLLGLGALTAVVGGNGKFVADKLSIGVTTGNSYTVAISVQQLLAAAREMSIPRETARLTIVGATGSIGRACARLLAPFVAHLTLVARQISPLKLLGRDIAETWGRSVTLETDARKSVQNADLVLLATSATGMIIDVGDIKPGAVVANVAKPDNIDLLQRFKRPDVLMFDAGFVGCPEKRVVEVFNKNFPYVAGIDSQEVFGCFAETIILAFEEQFNDYSLGRDLDPLKIKAIAEAGLKHGFFVPELAPRLIS